MFGGLEAWPQAQTAPLPAFGAAVLPNPCLCYRKSTRARGRFRRTKSGCPDYFAGSLAAWLRARFDNAPRRLYNHTVLVFRRSVRGLAANWPQGYGYGRYAGKVESSSRGGGYRLFPPVRPSHQRDGMAGCAARTRVPCACADSQRRGTANRRSIRACLRGGRICAFSRLRLFLSSCLPISRVRCLHREAFPGIRRLRGLGCEIRQRAFSPNRDPKHQWPDRSNRLALERLAARLFRTRNPG